MRHEFSTMICLALLVSAVTLASAGRAQAIERPNILLAISDDQSFPHCSAYGAKVRTPGFDRVAAAGVLFENAFAASPGCSPSRAALLTGRHAWELKEAGTHASSFPADLQVYPALLAAAGYQVGLTGKGWGPGNFATTGWKQNPAGKSFDGQKVKSPPKGISSTNYAGNFTEFLNEKPADQPFCFWYGAHEPHRPYAVSQQSTSHGIDQVPGFLPDHATVRADLESYSREIEWFDHHLMQMLDELKTRGLLENTIVIVTADNGMPFPRAKANCYESGWHVPMAISWPAALPGGQRSTELVSFIDIAPTFLEAAGLTIPAEVTGRSLLPMLRRGVSTGSTHSPSSPRESIPAVFCSRERHSSSRWNNLGYPMRAIRTADYLLIWNIKPDRWPAGAPHEAGSAEFAYRDIDACPTLDLMVQQREQSEIGKFLRLAVARRPEFELYDIKKDPANLRNLVDEPSVRETQHQLLAQLKTEMRRTKDPRANEEPTELFESYKRFSPLRNFPEPTAVSGADAIE